MTRLVLLLAFGLGGCIPYAVGHGPGTVPPGEVEQRVSFQAVSGHPDLDGDPVERGTAFSQDTEVRFGLTDRSDAGARLVGGASGVVATYKRRLGGEGPEGTAFVVGGGLIGLGSHIHLEASLLRSVDLGGGLVPYAGVRAQHAIAFFGDAAELNPVVGGFAGVHLQRGALSVSPELGVFYSAPESRGEQSLILVPSITIRGASLLEVLGLSL